VEKMRKRDRILPAFLLGTVLIASCGPQEMKKQADKVTVQLKWVHPAQFSGFYIGKMMARTWY